MGGATERMSYETSTLQKLVYQISSVTDGFKFKAQCKIARQT
jgi:hypothetical protein